MRGKDGKTLEESMMCRIFGMLEDNSEIRESRIVTDIQKLNKKMEKSYQKVGIVKYDAFNEMGGKLELCT